MNVFMHFPRMTIHHSVLQNSQGNSAQDAERIRESLDRQLLTNSHFYSEVAPCRAVD